MKTLCVNLPEDVGRAVLDHLNSDDGWRSVQADRLVAAEDNAVRFTSGRRAADTQRERVAALAVLSARLADVLPSTKGKK